jgi:hypothetical protein
LSCRNLQSDKAREVLEQSAARGSSQFERSLIDAVISDLEIDDRVQPAQLQLVATRLRRDGAKNRTRYEELGQKSGILGSFIKEELQRLPKPAIGEIALRKLCAPDGQTKSPVDVSLDELVDELKAKGLTDGADRESLLGCLSQFEMSRIIVQTESKRYNLVHDTFAPLIRQATAGRETEGERANRLLLRYIADFQQDQKIRIPLQHLRLIRRYARPSLLSDAQSRHLLRRSYITAISALCAPVLVVVVPVVAYAVAWDAWYISTQPASYRYGPPEIVIRHGHPNLRFLPGADRIWKRPDLNLTDLDPANPAAADEVPKGAIWGWAANDEEIRAVLARISPMRRAEFQRLLGDLKSALSTVRDQINSSLSVYFLNEAAEGVGLFARADPAKVSERELSLLYGDAIPQAPYPQSVRLMATLALLQIAEDKPEVGDKINVSVRDALDIFSRMVRRSASENPSWDTPLVEETLNLLVLRKQQPPSLADIEFFFSVLRDERNDPWARARDFQLLEAFSATNDAAAAFCIKNLLQFVVDRGFGPKNGAGWLTEGAMRVIPLLASRLSTPVNANTVQPILRDWLSQDALNEQTVVMSAIPISFLYRSQPAAIPEAVLEKLKGYVEETGNPERARAIAAISLVRAGSSDDRWQNSTVVGLLAGIFENNTELRGLKRAAASAATDMALAGQLKPEEAARALNTIGQILQNRDEARDDSWELKNLDLVLD